MAKSKYIGTGSVASIIGLIAWFMLSPYFLVEIDLSDKTCAGDFFDVCEVEYNLTYNGVPSYFYIYNKDKVELEFIPNVKDVIYCKKDNRYTSSKRANREEYPCGIGWREKNWNEPLTEQYSYIEKFYKNKKQQFKLVIFKYSPTDNIKWGGEVFGEGFDPYLLPVDIKDNTTTDKTSIIDNIVDMTKDEWCALSKLEQDNIKDDFWEIEEKASLDDKKGLNFITHVPVTWEHKTFFQDELTAQIEQLSSTEFLLFPITARALSVDAKSYTWKIGITIGKETTYINTEQTKEALEKGIYFKVPEGTREFSIILGESSTRIDASANLLSTFKTADNICRSKDGRMHVAYEGGSDDLWYGYSDNNGGTWEIKELLAGTVFSVGIICYDNQSVLVYFEDDTASDIDGFISTSNGLSFDSQFTISDTGTLTNPSATLAPDGSTIYMCIIDGTVATGAGIRLVNSTAWDTTIEVHDNSSDNSQYCDVQVDSTNNIWVWGIGDDFGRLEVWNSTSGWGNQKYYGIIEGDFVNNDGEYMSARIRKLTDGSEYVYVAFMQDYNLSYCRTDLADINWECQHLSDDPASTPDLAVTNEGAVEILFGSDDSSGSGDVIYRVHADDGWMFTSNETIQTNSGIPEILDQQGHYTTELNTLASYIYCDKNNDLYYSSYLVSANPIVLENLRFGAFNNTQYNETGVKLEAGNLSGDYITPVQNINASYTAINMSYDCTEVSGTNCSGSIRTNNVSLLSPGNLIGHWDFNTLKYGDADVIENTGLFSKIIGEPTMMTWATQNITVDENSRFEKGLSYAGFTGGNLPVPNGLTTSSTTSMAKYWDLYENSTTFCAWIYPERSGYIVSHNNVIKYFVHSAYNDTHQQGIAECYDNTDTKRTIQQIVIPKRQWILYCLYKNSSHLKVNVYSEESPNGVNTNRYGSALTTVCPGLRNYDNRLGIGTSGSQYSGLNGTIDEVFMFNKTLSNETTLKLYQDLYAWSKWSEKNYSSPMSIELNNTPEVQGRVHFDSEDIMLSAKLNGVNFTSFLLVSAPAIPYPDQVENLVNISITNTSIQIQFNYTDDTATKALILLDDVNTINLTYPTNIYNITSLTHNTEYNITVESYNESGTNDTVTTENSILVTTSETPTPSGTFIPLQINNLINASITNISIYIAFNYTDDNTTTAIIYLDEVNTINLTYPDIDYNITGLSPNTEYNITIDSYNETTGENTSQSSENSIQITTEETVVILPYILLDLIYPLTNISVTFNEFFNVTVEVECAGTTDCNDVNVSLDPTPYENVDISDYVSWYNLSEFIDIDNWEDWGTNGLDMDDSVSELVTNSHCVGATCMHYNGRGTKTVEFILGNPISENWTISAQINSESYPTTTYSRFFGADNANMGAGNLNSSMYCQTTQDTGTVNPNVDLGAYSLDTPYVVTCFKNGTTLCGQIDNGTVSCTNLDGTQTNSQWFSFGGTVSGLNGSFSSGGAAYTRALNGSERQELYACLSTGGNILEGCTTSAESTKTGLISNVSGTTPFYTNNTNPRTVSLTAGEKLNVTFWVNATGSINGTFEFFAYVNQTSNMSNSNITQTWNVTIIAASTTSTCTCPGIDTDWGIDCSENCELATCDIGTGNLWFYGTGYPQISNQITINKITNGSSTCHVWGNSTGSIIGG